MPFKVTIDQENWTYATKRMGERDYADFQFEDEPTETLHLVRVEGRDGNSFGSEPTSWDVDVFNSKEEAESLADKIDLNYDVWTMLKWIRCQSEYHAPHDVPKDRVDLLAELFRGFKAMDEEAQRKYRRDVEERIEYVNGTVTTVCHPYQWKGYFASMEQVMVVDLVPEAKARKRWRRRF